MNDILTEDLITHLPKEELLREAEEIKSERQILRERLDKLEQSRATVSDAVYQKVRADYGVKMNASKDRLNLLKKGLEAEEKIITDKKSRVETHLKNRREKIEETSLRKTLGEYTEEEYQKILTSEQAEIARLEQALDSLNKNLDRTQGLFEKEEVSEKTTREPSPALSFTENTARIRLQNLAKEPEHSHQPVEDNEKTLARLPHSGKPLAESFSHPITTTDVRKPAELVVFEGGENKKIVQTLALDHTIHIGRSPSNDVILKESKVSRKHAEIQFANGHYVLLDLNSSNGTFIGDQRVTEHVLQPNEEILIGNTKIAFRS